MNKMKEASTAKPVVIKWVTPVLFVPKNDGSLHFCVSYRRLNSVPVQVSYPVPRVDECIDSLGEAQMILILDTNSGY